MKAIKMIGLAALTVLLAMALVGASSAMAEKVQLCGHDAPEGEGFACEAIHHVHDTSVGKAKILLSIGTTECEALFLGDVKSFGAPAVISGKFTYSNCTLGGASCTATEENGPAEIKVLKTENETTEVTGEYLVHLKCSASIDCSYTGVGLKGTGKGALKSTQENGEVTISEALLTKEAGGFLCPKTTKLDITTTPLSKVYIAKELLGYCVKTEHTNGIYEDSKCEKIGGTEVEHKYNYALVFAPEGGIVGETVCYGTLAPYGLWKAFNKFNVQCKEDDLGVPTTSLYEKGTVVTVE